MKKFILNTVKSLAFLATFNSVFALDANDLNQAIRLKKLNWQARTVSESERRNYGLGWNKEKEKSTADYFEPDAQLLLPEKLDWTNKDGRNWVSPVRNQGPCGACVAFSVTGLFEAHLNIANNTPGLDLNLSEQDLLSRTGSCEAGAQFDSTLYALVSGGEPDEGCMLYKAVDIPFSKTCKNRSDRAFYASRVKRIRKNQIRHALQYGPVLTGMAVYDDFFAYTTGVYKYVKGPLAGGHGIVIVGYNDEERAYIVKNSWGAYWGDHGYVKISYDETHSGFGNVNYMIDVDNPAIAANFKTPLEIRTYYADTKVKAQNLTEENLGGLKASLVSHHEPVEEIKLELNSVTNEGKISPKNIQAGTYDLILSVADGTDRWHPFYTTAIIQKVPADLALNLVPKFKSEEPVKDRIEFEIITQTKQENTLFERVSLVFIDKVGAEKENVTETPDAKFIFGWRTQQLSDGEYVVFARGHIGETIVESKPRLKVKIQNNKTTN